MNDERIFVSKKKWMLLLLKLGMPSLVIHKMLDVSESTAYKYLTRLRKKKEWKEEILPQDKARPQMLKLYAHLQENSFLSSDENLYLDTIEFKERDGFLRKLERVLAVALEEEKILQTIAYALPAITSFSEIIYVDGIPAGYRRLIEKLWPSYRNQSLLEILVWKEYLAKINHSEALLPKTKEFLWGKNHFVGTIIQSYAQDIRKYIAPMLTVRICPLIDEALKKIGTREKEVIELYYGVHCEPLSLEMIGEKAAMTKERVRQIKERSIRRLKNILRNDLKSISNAWEEQQIVKEQYDQDIKEIKERNKQIFSAMDEAYRKKFMELGNPDAGNIVQAISVRPEETDALLLYVTDVNLGVRTYNCLRAAEIAYIWELVQMHRYDLLRFRNFGDKSLKEIDQFFKEKGLTFGMRFSAAQIAYFESRTTKKEK